ncbi:MAG TPA: GAF domain-containing protein, partial [Ktedonobacteraceae bacterium]|nr:GAF domain-containing protein [Ktedonobacteraceae bacterium]
MKTITTGQLRRGYLDKLGLQNYIAVAVVIAIVSLSLFWLVFRLGGADSVTLYSDSMYAIASLIGSSWAALTAYRMRYGPVRMEPRHQLAWLLIALGLFANAAGGFDYTILEQLGYINPVPASSDLGFTLFYMLIFSGLIIMPTQAKGERFRVRLALDALITTLCVFGVSWFFILSKIFALQNVAHVRPLTLLTVLSYPSWDILLILAIVLFIQKRTARILYPSLIICAAGIFSQGIADTLYAYTISSNTYSTGTPYIDPFWFVGYLLIGLAGLYQYSALARRAYNETTYSPQAAFRPESSGTLSNNTSDTHLNRLRSLLIYLPLAVLLTIMLYSEITQDHTDTSFLLVVLTAIVGFLVTVRYLFATRENESLLHEREQQHETSEHLQRLSMQMSKLLELDPLLGSIVSMATLELGFDAAMLILFEEDGLPLDRQSHLLIRAAAAPTGDILASRLHGSRIAHCTVLHGKTIEKFWPDPALALPPEIDAWYRLQRICSTLFVPLIHQGDTLGSLAFSRRLMQPFNAHEHYVASHFAELAATAIEHTRLYQTAREHYAFAQALANIATRLNSTLIEPAEIHQAICSEGA